MKYLIIVLLLFLGTYFSISGQSQQKAQRLSKLKTNHYEYLFNGKDDFIAKSFRQPVGKPEMKGLSVIKISDFYC